MRNRISTISFFLATLLAVFASTAALSAAPATATPSVITMKSPTLFTIDDQDVSAQNLISGLKKNKIPNSQPLVIEIPANTSREMLKDLTQRLMSAGYTPFFKPPRHAEASVKAANAPTAVTPPKKQKLRK